MPAITAISKPAASTGSSLASFAWPSLSSTFSTLSDFFQRLYLPSSGAISLLFSVFAYSWSVGWNTNGMDSATWMAIAQVVVLLVNIAVALYTARESKRKISAEARKSESEYWQTVAKDLRIESESMVKRIDQLEANDRSKSAHIQRLSDAFEFICETVKQTNPKAVKIARQMESGIVGGSESDIPESQ